MKTIIFCFFVVLVLQVVAASFVIETEEKAVGLSLHQRSFVAALLYVTTAPLLITIIVLWAFYG